MTILGKNYAELIIVNIFIILLFIHNEHISLFTGTGKQMTEEGLEFTYAANYFGHFLLTNLLLGNSYLIITIVIFYIQ